MTMYPPDAAQLLSTLRTGAWLDAQEFPPLSYTVPGLIPEGSVLLARLAETAPSR